MQKYIFIFVFLLTLFQHLGFMKTEYSLSNWKRVVIKVGSTLVAPNGEGGSGKYILPIANFIIQCRSLGKEVILVSSGAVAAGLSTQPKLQNKVYKSIPEKQALAAIGQTMLIQNWSRFFDFPCAQVLLTYDGLFNRERFINAKNTINELLKLKTLPIVNENDTVAVEELKVGDNDNLAAHVAVLSESDLLIICSDIDGLYDDNPNKKSTAKLIKVVEKIDDSIFSAAGSSNNPLAKGGMRTKIEAAQKAASRGIDTIIMNGTKRETFDELLKGNIKGSIIKKTENTVQAKKHWLLHAIPSSGKVYVDEGAKNAIVKKGASLLPSGIIKIEGSFTSGDAVNIVYTASNIEKIIAKGIILYDSKDLDSIKGKKSSEIQEILGYFNDNEVIHRRDIVLTEGQ